MSVIMVSTSHCAAVTLHYCSGKVREGQERCTLSENTLGAQDIRDLSSAWRNERKCYGKENGVQCSHVVYSLDPNDPKAKTISDRELADIGHEFASKVAPNHNYAVFVHRDREHPHIHIVWGSINLETGKKFQMGPPELRQAKEIKNQIDKAHGIAITVPKPEQVKVPWPVRRQLDKNPEYYSWKIDLYDKIIDARDNATSFKDFREKCKEHNITLNVRGNKNITYAFIDKDGKQHATRDKNCGQEFTYDNINESIKLRKIQRTKDELTRKIETNPRSNANPSTQRPDADKRNSAPTRDNGGDIPNKDKQPRKANPRTLLEVGGADFNLERSLAKTIPPTKPAPSRTSPTPPEPTKGRGENPDIATRVASQNSRDKQAPKRDDKKLQGVEVGVRSELPQSGRTRSAHPEQQVGDSGTPTRPTHIERKTVQSHGDNEQKTPVPGHNASKHDTTQPGKSSSQHSDNQQQRTSERDASSRTAVVSPSRANTTTKSQEVTLEFTIGGKCKLPLVFPNEDKLNAFKAEFLSVKESYLQTGKVENVSYTVALCLALRAQREHAPDITLVLARETRSLEMAMKRAQEVDSENIKTNKPSKVFNVNSDGLITAQTLHIARFVHSKDKAKIEDVTQELSKHNETIYKAERLRIREEKNHTEVKELAKSRNLRISEPGQTTYHSGAIIAVNKDYVLQKTGYDNATLHQTKNLDKIPQLGSNTTIQYDQGKGKTIEKSRSKGIEMDIF